MGFIISPHSKSGFYDAELEIHSLLSETQHVFLAFTNDDPRAMWFPIEEFTCQKQPFYTIHLYCPSSLCFCALCFQNKFPSIQDELKSPLFPFICHWLVEKLVKYLFSSYIFFHNLWQCFTFLPLRLYSTEDPPQTRRVHYSPSVNSWFSTGKHSYREM